MNDLVHFILKQVANQNDKTFSNADFAHRFSKIAELKNPLDGNIVKTILCGRSDVLLLDGGSHYKFIE